MAAVPREALRCPTLNNSAKVVLSALWSYAGRDKRFVWPSRDTLAADCGGVSAQTLRRALKSLESSGWIVSDNTGRHPGWCLCDPPGNIVHRSNPPLNGSHDRPNVTTKTDRVATKVDRAAVKTDRPVLTERPKLTAETTKVDRPCSIGTNQEPIGGEYSTHTVESAAPAAAPPPPRVDVSTWRSTWVSEWRERFSGATPISGWQVSDPTRSSSRLAEVSAALEEHGPDIVRDVLFHAAEQVVRWQDSKSRQGMHPGKLAVCFAPERPGAWMALLDAWQAATQRKRVSGRIAAAPSELDGVPLSDEDARVWMRAMGESPEQAVRDHRALVAAREQETEAAAAGFLGLGVSA